MKTSLIAAGITFGLAARLSAQYVFPDNIANTGSLGALTTGRVFMSNGALFDGLNNNLGVTVSGGPAPSSLSPVGIGTYRLTTDPKGYTGYDLGTFQLGDGAVNIPGVALGGKILFLSRNREPSYADRSLSDWLVALADNSPAGDPERAEEAIREMGSNALPYLVRYGAYSSPFVRLGRSRAGLPELGSWLGRVWSRPFRTAEARRDGALLALGILGTQAASTIPELTRLMESPKDFHRAS